MVKKEVYIRTLGNMCELTIYAPQDHIDHYGYAKETNVVKVANASYHEFGTSSQLVVASGKVVVENSGVVFELKQDDFKKTSDGQYISETKYNAMESKPTVAESFTKDESPAITNNGGNVMASSVSTVTASTSFEINNLSQLEAFRDATNSGENFAGKTINLNCDITLSGAWTPISNYYRGSVANGTKAQKTDISITDLAFAGIFDGHGHTIFGLTNKDINVSKVNTGFTSSTPDDNTEVTYGFFASVNNATIKNLVIKDVDIVMFETLLGDRVAACVGYTHGNTIIENVKVYGSIFGYDVVGGIVGGARGSSITIKNCENHATVHAIRQAGGIIAQVGNFTANTSEIDSCKNFGAVSSNYGEDAFPKSDAGNASGNWYQAGGIVGCNNITNGNKCVVKNCTAEQGSSVTNSKYTDHCYEVAPAGLLVNE